MNRIETLFKEKPKNILSVYFTAGYPSLNDTLPILKELQAAGVDMVEIGMPFSDPLADGPVIQQSSQKALANGMSMKILFDQLKAMRIEIRIPVILMGYLNPVMRYGMERFLKDAARLGIDGLILPDLPVEEYGNQYAVLFKEHKLCNILLITPQTSEERLRQIDSLSSGFVYMVSSASTTGTKKQVFNTYRSYFEKISRMSIQNPRLIGFGISDRKSYLEACTYANGAIIGTAFIRALEGEGDLKTKIGQFVREII